MAAKSIKMSEVEKEQARMIQGVLSGKSVIRVMVHSSCDDDMGGEVTLVLSDGSQLSFSTYDPEADSANPTSAALGIAWYNGKGKDYFEVTAGVKGMGEV